MITLRRAGEPHRDGVMVDEGRLPPGAGVPRRWLRRVEVLTYVREGALAFEDSAGRAGIIRAGEFHCTAWGRGLRHGAKNASRADWAQVFQVWLGPEHPRATPEQENQQKRFGAADRRGRLCLVASPDGDRGSLRIDHDARVYSAVLEPGRHVALELVAGRSAWLQIVQGQVTLGDLALGTGDSAAATGEWAVSLTAIEAAEILLLDLGAAPAP